MLIISLLVICGCLSWEEYWCVEIVRLLRVGNGEKIELGGLVSAAGHWLMTVLRETVSFRSPSVSF